MPGSIVSDILDIVKEVRAEKYFDTDSDDGSVVNIAAFGRKSSISKIAKGAILQFPVLVSNTISIDDVVMVSKALERNYATLVRIATGLDDVIDGQAGENKASYLKKFHQNQTSSNAPDAAYSIMSDSANVESITNANKDALKPYMEDLRTRSLNDLNTSSKLSEAPGDIKEPITRTDITKSPYANQLLNNDVQKANELIPTTLDIAVQHDSGSGSVAYTHILVGIKAVCHLIESDQMTFNISKSIEEKRGFFRFIQWTSGEIQFFKDYLLCLDRIKKEALSQRNDSHWWRSLKTRANISKLRSYTFSKNSLMPNATIVVSMDEVEYIMNNYNIDLLNNKKVVRQLMDTFFLLGFVILDTSAELGYFFFDGETDYQTYGFSALEKETNQKRDMKAMVSLMNNNR